MPCLYMKTVIFDEVDKKNDNTYPKYNPQQNSSLLSRVVCYLQNFMQEVLWIQKLITDFWCLNNV